MLVCRPHEDDKKRVTFVLSVPVTLAFIDSLQLGEDGEAKLWLHFPTVGKNGANAGTRRLMMDHEGLIMENVSGDSSGG